MNYEENELENYAHYMDFIRKSILEENAELNLIIEESQINFGHIDRIAVCRLDDMSSCTWGFQYTIKRSIGKNEWVKEMRYSQQIAYDEWARLQKVETRNKLIEGILEGLEPEHKIILVEGLKKQSTSND